MSGGLTEMPGSGDPLEGAAARRRATGPLGRLLRSVARCLPLIAGGCLFAHLTWFGLRPALVEQRRLEEASLDVHARRVGLETELGTLERRRAALDDPFYRERLRRSERARQARDAAELLAAGAASSASAPAEPSSPETSLSLPHAVPTAGATAGARRSLVR